MNGYHKVVIAAGVLLAFAAAPVESVGPAADVYTPAHSSVAEAARHFFWIRSEPTQPVAFNHQVHIETVQLGCTECHINVSRGPRATIPDIRTCWNCHENAVTKSPEVDIIKSFHDKGQDIPWQRVYGWTDEAHVRFNHAPHIRAKVECSTCHGDVAQMTVAKRVVNHTMGFCLNCHRERQLADDCLTCHY